MGGNRIILLCLTRDNDNYKIQLMETPTKLERFIDASNKGKFTMDEELGMINHLLTKYNFISKSEYARIQGISPQGVRARLKSNKDPYLNMIGKTFIVGL